MGFAGSAGVLWRAESCVRIILVYRRSTAIPSGCLASTLGGDDTTLPNASAQETSKLTDLHDPAPGRGARATSSPRTYHGLVRRILRVGDLMVDTNAASCLDPGRRAALGLPFTRIQLACEACWFPSSRAVCAPQLEILEPLWATHDVRAADLTQL